jgi:hypothetical protein
MVKEVNSVFAVPIPSPLLKMLLRFVSSITISCPNSDQRRVGMDIAVSEIYDF